MPMHDLIIIGAGAAGLMCAISAAQLGKNVLLLEHGNRAGRKILISGGGRCNFTNHEIAPEKYLSQNPHFCKSAFSQYSQWDFIHWVEQHNIAYHEKQQGQLFCDDSAKNILNGLLKDCERYDVTIRYQTNIDQIIEQSDGTFLLKVQQQSLHTQSLIIATGGLSMPRLGATPFAYRVAEQFNINILPTRAGLVPFTLDPKLKSIFSECSGTSLPVETYVDNISFQDDLLVTHRGLSGPAILQISSYWNGQDTVNIAL